MGKDRSLPKSEASELCFTQICSGLSNIIQGQKHSSLLGPFVNYGRKKFYNIGPQNCSYFQSSASQPAGANLIKLFFVFSGVGHKYVRVSVCVSGKLSQDSPKTRVYLSRAKTSLRADSKP